MSNPASLDSLAPDLAAFRAARYGLFIHFGPYALQGRGEQVLMRELPDQRAYAAAACAWNPRRLDPRAWAEAAVAGGFRYAVLTTRHHDGFCLWDTATTDYSSAAQAMRRDLVREFTDAFRAAGLRVGLYYSWSDFRLPAFFAGPERDPAGWAEYQALIRGQLDELLTRYGRIDQLWFDGTWPWSAAVWDSENHVRRARALQPRILVNNRLGWAPGAGNTPPASPEDTGNRAPVWGDFGTPEHHITADPNRAWESCQVSTWRLWGHAPGERWRSADLWLDFLCDAAAKGGNLLLNVGPDAEGAFPDEFLVRNRQVGDWLRVHGEAIFGTTPVDAGETVLFGRVTRRDNTLYLLVRFWPPGGALRYQGLATRVRRATLLGDESAALEVEHDERGVTIRGLPARPPSALCAVIRLELEGAPSRHATYHPGLWGGDPMRLHAWASARGRGVMADGAPRA